MTVGLELVCWAGAGTADANATKNKKTSSEPLALRNFRIHPDYFGQCPLATVLWAGAFTVLLGEAEHSIYARVRLIASRGGPKKVTSDTNISRFHRKSQLLVIAALVQVTFAFSNTEVIAFAVYMRCHIHLIMRGDAWWTWRDSNSGPLLAKHESRLQPLYPSLPTTNISN